MSEKKLKSRRIRDSSDKTTNISLSIRLSQLEKTDNFVSNNPYFNRSSLIRHTIDEFFQNLEQSKEIRIELDSNKFPINIVALIIGESIGRDIAIDCIFSWLEGRNIPEIKIESNTQRIINSFNSAISNNQMEGEFVEHCISFIDSIGEMFCNASAFHLSAYILCKRELERSTDTAVRAAIINKINDMIRIEYDIISNLIAYSPHVRFAVYICWKHNKFRVKYPFPEWVSKSRDSIVAMNHLWRE